MRISIKYESEEIGNDCVLVSLDGNNFNGIIRTNRSAMFIIESLQNDITEDNLIKQYSSQFAINIDTATRDVRKILSQLREDNLLIE